MALLAPMIAQSPAAGVHERKSRPKAALDVELSTGVHFLSPPGTLPSTPFTKKLMPPRNLSSATASLASTSLPVLSAIGPFQITKLPSFRPAFTSSSFFFASSGTCAGRDTKAMAPSLTPHQLWPVLHLLSSASCTAFL